MQLRPPPAAVHPAESHCFAATSASGDGNQGGEMTVPVTELKGLDTADAGRHGFVERVGSAGGESGLAILFPHTVERLEPRC